MCSRTHTHMHTRTCTHTRTHARTQTLSFLSHTHTHTCSLLTSVLSSFFSFFLSFFSFLCVCSWHTPVPLSTWKCVDRGSWFSVSLFTVIDKDVVTVLRCPWLCLSYLMETLWTEGLSQWSVYSRCSASSCSIQTTSSWQEVRTVYRVITVHYYYYYYYNCCCFLVFLCFDARFMFAVMLPLIIFFWFSPQEITRVRTWTRCMALKEKCGQSILSTCQGGVAHRTLPRDLRQRNLDKKVI